MTTLLNLVRYLTDNTRTVLTDEEQPHILIFATYDYNTQTIKNEILKKFNFHILDKSNDGLDIYLLENGINLHRDTVVFEQIDREYMVVWNDTYIYLIW